MQGEVLALFYLGQFDLAEKRIDEYKRLMVGWPAAVIDKFDGVNGWENAVRQRMVHESIHAVIESQVKQLRLEKIPDLGIRF
ncbi:MAG: hypothetical protein Q4G71_14875 [Pseudomonadota bacterium]|nr:hypothetical protein [Pseudomonadota bacterium]